MDYSNKKPSTFISFLRVIRDILISITLARNKIILRLTGVKFGTNLRSYSPFSISSPWKLVIGNDVWIGKNCALYAENGIKIGNNVVIAKDCSLISFDHLRNSKGIIELIKEESKPIVIEDGVWLGDKVIVLKKVRIGKMSIIGAGSVLTHDIPPYSVAVGNPARVVKKVRH